MSFVAGDGTTLTFQMPCTLGGNHCLSLKVDSSGESSENCVLESEVVFALSFNFAASAVTGWLLSYRKVLKEYLIRIRSNLIAL